MRRSQATPRQDLDTITAFLGATGGTLLVIGSAVGWRSLGSADKLLDRGGTYTIAFGTLGCTLAALLFLRAGGLRRWQAGMGFLVLAMLTSGFFILVNGGCMDCSTLGLGVGVFVFGLPSAAFLGAFVAGFLGLRSERVGRSRQALDRVAAVLGAIGGALVVTGSLLPWLNGSRILALASASDQGFAAVITGLNGPILDGVDLRAGKVTLVLGILGCVLGAALFVGAAGLRRRRAGFAFLAIAAFTATIAIVGAVNAVGNESALNESHGFDSTIQWAVGGVGVPVMVFGIGAFIAAFGLGVARGRTVSEDAAASANS